MDAVKRFFSSPRFAVAGASNDPAKFGFKSLSPFLPFYVLKLTFFQSSHGITSTPCQ
jgi:hypothetical protein